MGHLAGSKELNGRAIESDSASVAADPSHDPEPQKCGTHQRESRCEQAYPVEEGAVANATNRTNVYQVCRIPGEVPLQGPGGRSRWRRLPCLRPVQVAGGLVVGREDPIVSIPRAWLCGNRREGNLSKRRLSRNAVFRPIVLDILSDGSGMYLRDICSKVKAKAPEWCSSN